jgi:phage shock protein PspC (stress-responsive transcriptional regulator)
MMGAALNIGIVFSTLLMFYFMWIGSYIVLSALMNKYKEVKA